ncbi:uncharacterized protein L201_003781 [Kwoniella dendrophila CBS 6074]|uniref:Uncharacterized protein n=1 Tax=Kwoniella dendrophila CBS 6074 TaxID=1295534 RepID=A0AAX4JUK4_9TREE
MPNNATNTSTSTRDEAIELTGSVVPDFQLSEQTQTAQYRSDTRSAANANASRQSTISGGATCKCGLGATCFCGCSS